MDTHSNLDLTLLQLIFLRLPTPRDMNMRQRRANRDGIIRHNLRDSCDILQTRPNTTLAHFPPSPSPHLLTPSPPAPQQLYAPTPSPQSPCPPPSPPSRAPHPHHPQRPPYQLQSPRPWPSRPPCRNSTHPPCSSSPQPEHPFPCSPDARCSGAPALRWATRKWCLRLRRRAGQGPRRRRSSAHGL